MNGRFHSWRQYLKGLVQIGRLAKTNQVSWKRFMLSIHPRCCCSVRPRRENESERDWIKDISCMYHWMESKYYAGKS